MYGDGISAHGEYHSTGFLVNGSGFYPLSVFIPSIELIIIYTGEGIAYCNGKEVGIQSIVLIYCGSGIIQNHYMLEDGSGHAVDAFSGNFYHAISSQSGSVGLSIPFHFQRSRVQGNGRIF